MNEFKNLDRELYNSMEVATGERDDLKASYVKNAMDVLESGNYEDYSEGN